MPKLKAQTMMPSPEEDREIENQIKKNPDEFEWSNEMFHDAKSFEDSDLPQSFKNTIRKNLSRKTSSKVLLSVQYSPEVVDFFKSTGSGWKSRMDEVLREYVGTHQ